MVLISTTTNNDLNHEQAKHKLLSEWFKAASVLYWLISVQVKRSHKTLTEQ
jgi:hypothetical protein